MNSIFQQPDLYEDSTGCDRVSLSWIRDELQELMKAARNALERYSEWNEADGIDQCSDAIHQLHSTLSLINLYGASMLTEELEAVVRRLKSGDVVDAEGASEALMTGLVSLEDFLDRLANGAPDVSITLMPIMNELRAVRDETLLSESAFFSPHLEEILAAELSQPVHDQHHLADFLTEHRREFHKNLLMWYRDQDTATALDGVAEFCSEAARKATAPVRRFFELANALANYLAQKPAKSSVANKLVIAKLDALIRKVMQEGEDAVRRDYPTEQLKNLLFYVGQIDSDVPHIEALKNQYNLHKELVFMQDKGQSVAKLAPSVLQAVSEAIEKDIVSVKDAIDIYSRAEVHDNTVLQSAIPRMKNLADTMGMLGLGLVRKTLNAQTDVLQDEIDNDRRITLGILGGVAELLLQVERMLPAIFTMPKETLETQDHEELISEAEYYANVWTVIREAKTTLAYVKEGIATVAKGMADTELLENIAALLHQVRGAVSLIDDELSFPLFTRLIDFVESDHFNSSSDPTAEQMNAIADAITGLEYYIEVVPYRCRKEDDILDYVANALEHLEIVPLVAEVEEEAQEAEPEQVTIIADTEKMAPGVPDAELSIIPSQTAEATPQAAEAKQQQEPAPVSNDIDEEILEIFREEAADNLQIIQQHYAFWRDNPNDQESLSTFRRSFHTLKGSGRMVGDLVVGEYAWTTERLLNKVLDGTVSRSPQLINYLDNVVEHLPGMIAHTDPSGEAQVITDAEKQVELLLHPELAEAVEEPVEQQPQSTEPDTVEAGYDPAKDEELVQIFREESDAHLATLTEHLAHDGLSSVPNDDLFQALHTLHGSADMAGFTVIADLSHAMEQLVRRRREMQQLLSSDDLVLMKEAQQELRTNLEQLTTGNLVANKSLEDRLLQQAEQSSDREFQAGTAEGITSLFTQIEEEEQQPSEEEPVVEGEPVEAVEIESKAQSLESETAPTAADYLLGVSNELIEAFSEEAKELLEEIESAFSTVSDNRLDDDVVARFKRALHTMKGSSRLVGEEQIGDLSHAFEAMLIRATDAGAIHYEPTYRMARQATDQMALLVDKIGKADKTRPDALIFALESFDATQFEPVVEEHQEAAPEQVQPEVIPVDEQPVEEVTPVSEPGMEPEEEEATATESEELPETETHVAETPATASAEVITLRSAATSPARRKTGDESDKKRLRVSSKLLETVSNGVAEAMTLGSRLQQQSSFVGSNLTEFERTVSRLREQLRKLEIETESQILHRYEREGVTQEEAFDPLELDRFSTIQELSRALAETVDDLTNIKKSIDSSQEEASLLLNQHVRLTTSLQDLLMGTRTIPFKTQVARIERLVRQTAEELGKQARLEVNGVEQQIDRGVLDRTMPLIEHLVRNAISHGIESPEERAAHDKDKTGQLTLDIARQGMEVVITLADDGKGFDFERIHQRAVETGLWSADDQMSEMDMMRVITQPGFTTTDSVDQISGRGVGLDVVSSGIEELGGRLVVTTTRGNGSRFTIHLPFNLAITDVLMLNYGEQWFAIPNSLVEAVTRVTQQEVDRFISNSHLGYEYGGEVYPVIQLDTLLGIEHNPHEVDIRRKWHPLILIKGEQPLAILTGELHGSRQVVLKSVGIQLESVPWISGGTIMGDGSIALVIDPSALVESRDMLQTLIEESAERESKAPAREAPLVMVVDDSITMRKVASSVLERNGYDVVTAKDGLDALAQLEFNIPDLILLDIEMPRMDGFEFAHQVRSSSQWSQIPIIMITSRSGEKHRQRAMELGVNSYMGKPFQEDNLIEEIASLLVSEEAG